MAIVVNHPLHLAALRFPMMVQVKVWKGRVTLRNQTVCRILEEGQSFVVPTFLRFDCEVMPLAQRPAEFSLTLIADAGIAVDAVDDGKLWSLPLAREIFAAPQRHWTAAQLAAHWQVTPQKARARLFAEGETLNSLVREQRLVHALHIAASMDDPGARDINSLASRAGFTSATTFAAACTEIARVPADHLLRTVVRYETLPANRERGLSPPRHRRFF